MPRTMKLTFADNDEDQALHRALCESSELYNRRPVTQQVKHILELALGLRVPENDVFGSPDHGNTVSQNTRPVLRLVPKENDVEAGSFDADEDGPLGA